MAKVMGMMSGCYFVGRGELLEWLNDLLKINYTKVEETSNGAAFCQIIDVIHPGTVALGRVNYNATQGFEMTQNYKILQDAFHKNEITQYIDVVTLTKGKYMAALELLQWIHGYFEQTGPHPEYDAVSRRAEVKCKPPKEKEQDKGKKSSGFPTSKPSIPIKMNDKTIGHIPKAGAKKSQGIRESARKEEITHQKPKHEISRVSVAHSSQNMDNGNLNSIDKQTLEQKITNSKLQEIEAYCLLHEDNPEFAPILEIIRKV